MVGFAGHHQIYLVVPGYFFQLQVETDGQREGHLPDSNTKKRRNRSSHRKGRPEVMAYELRKRELKVERLIPAAIIYDHFNQGRNY